MLRSVYRLAETIARWLAYAGVGALALGAVLNVFDISTRRTVGFTVPGMVDLTQLFVMACVFLAIPHAFMREAQVGVDFVTDRLPPRALAALKGLIAVASAVLMGASMFSSATQAWRQIESGDMSQTIGVPIVWYWLPLLAGLGLAAIVCVILAARYAVLAAGGEDVARPAGA
ncbi:MAG: TRAP transporter small permease [Burkholderiales bacterium]|jgi:TRAP-type C4-dicarboxylate transport system permease small subunit|nr:TRAP transporter small permease [Burkholderiales bacterium]